MTEEIFDEKEEIQRRADNALPGRRLEQSTRGGILRQAESGVPVSELCREHGMSSASFTNGERSLAACPLGDCMQSPAGQWMAVEAVASRGISVAQACRTFSISESCYRYERQLSDENAEISEWLVKLTSNRRTWGFGLCFLYLRNVKGFGWNHKRVYRIYCELELNLRIRPKKRLIRDRPDALAVPDTANHTWSMDLMADQLADGRSIRTLNRIIEWRGKPLIIRVDNGPEYVSGMLMAWAERMGIHIQYIQPGKPQQNAYIERYNRTVRHEWLDQNIFETIVPLGECRHSPAG
jgi:putative transposase